MICWILVAAGALKEDSLAFFVDLSITQSGQKSGPVQGVQGWIPRSIRIRKTCTPDPNGQDFKAKDQGKRPYRDSWGRLVAWPRLATFLQQSRSIRDGFMTHGVIRQLTAYNFDCSESVGRERFTTRRF